MNILIDGLPDTVLVGGHEIQISTDYRTGILFEEAIMDRTLSDTEKLQTMIELYYPGKNIPAECLSDAVEKAIWFYRCGRDRSKDTAHAEENQGPCFSYEYDADYIYAAFLEVYHIDLAEKFLHWWQFNALFKSLPDDTRIMQIIGYRVMKIPEKAPKERRAFYRRMKEIYRLPDETEQTQLETDLTALLMKGGNPSALFERENS